MPVVKKTVEQGTDGSGVAQQFSPVLDRTIQGQECAGPFVAPRDDQVSAIPWRGLGQSIP